MPKTTPFRELNKDFTPEDRAKVEAMKAELRAQMTLEEVREALDLTQMRLAKLLHTTQANVSRLERRHDLLLSTLRAYCRSLGGDLELSVRFPGAATVKLKGLGELHKSAR